MWGTQDNLWATNQLSLSTFCKCIFLQTTVHIIESFHSYDEVCSQLQWKSKEITAAEKKERRESIIQRVMTLSVMKRKRQMVVKEIDLLLRPLALFPKRDPFKHYPHLRLSFFPSPPSYFPFPKQVFFPPWGAAVAQKRRNWVFM